jgi:hypothetical protein
MNRWICYKDLVKRNRANGDESRSLFTLLEFKLTVTMGLLSNGLILRIKWPGGSGDWRPRSIHVVKLKVREGKVS